MAAQSDRDGFLSLFDCGLGEWVQSGRGGFLDCGDGSYESFGGPGLLWYRPRRFGDLLLTVEWRLGAITDNSGVFLRFPPLGTDDPDSDWKAAVEQGYEVQIDDRGHDPEAKREGNALHLTGAIYRMAPARQRASRPVGAWNVFTIEAHGRQICVALNGVTVARLDEDRGRPARGHIGLQNHHEGSKVAFRNLRVKPLDEDSGP